MENNRKLRQVRSIPQKFITREAEGGPVIEGYFALYNSKYVLWDDAYETIAVGAFDGALEDDIRALVDHDTRLVLGRNKSGTLTLSVDKTGLYGVIKINEKDGDAMNLYARVQRGDVSQCSFGFDILDEEYFNDPVGGTRWVIKSVKLYEVSVVTFPAYEETSVIARKRDYEEIQKRRLEVWRSEMKGRLQKHGA